MILDTIAATSLATMMSCICVSIELTTVVMSVCFEISRLYGGFFISPAQMSDFPDWHFADALSYIKYCFVGIALNELSDLELTCTTSEINTGKCVSSGNTIIEQRGYDQYSIGYNVGILIVYIFGCRLFGYLALRFFKK
jgi:ATP-binding cassette subfamily G (WHITE) protein 2